MALVPVSALGETDKADGLRLTPEISWSEGDHRFALHFNSRLRWERWESLTNKSDNIYAIRTRISGDYTCPTLSCICKRCRTVARTQHRFEVS